MKHFTLLRYVSGGAIFWLFLPVALAESSTARSHFQGVYLSSNVGTSMNLSLGADGTATVTEAPDGGDATTLFGRWADDGGKVTVRFDAVAGEPAEPPMIFQPAHDGLQAVSWNHAAWGKAIPPPMKKGYKVKQLYWLTQNR